MSWPDPARRDESAEDVALRSDLQDLLGIVPAAPVRTAPTAEQIALAEDLRREALRRRHTPALVPLRTRRPLWSLVAAGLPLVLGLAGFGLYGIQQKRRADSLAAAIRQKEVENDRLRQSHQEALARERTLQEQSQGLLQASGRGPASRKPRELVLPVDKPAATPRMPENLTVKNPR